MFVLQLVGYHDSGKTTLAEYLVRELQKRGFVVGYVKHDPKGKGVTDKEGSDTARVKPFTLKTALVSPDTFTLWYKRGLSLKEALKFFEDCDAVIVEGFKEEKGYPKVVVGDLPADEAILRVKSRRDYPKVLEFLLSSLEGGTRY